MSEDPRIASLDPGRSKNSFAFLGGTVTNEKIILSLAKRWKGSLKQNYVAIEKEIAERHQKKPFDVYVIETNHSGHHVIDVLKSVYGLPIVPVNTVGKLKDQNAHPFSQEKRDMMYYILHLKAEGKLEAPPENTSPEWAEFHRQVQNYQMILNKRTGSETFTSPDDNDDYVSALINFCWYARQRYLKVRRSNYRTINKRMSRDASDIYGTGLTDSQELVSRTIIFPN